MQNKPSPSTYSQRLCVHLQVINILKTNSVREYYPHMLKKLKNYYSNANFKYLLIKHLVIL